MAGVLRRSSKHLRRGALLRPLMYLFPLLIVDDQESFRRGANAVANGT